MRYTPWVVSEHLPDFSTLENMLKHPRFAGKKDGELAEALWALMVDRELGIYHYIPPAEPFWERDSNDPLLIWNVFGFTICHVHANVLATMMRVAGLKTRIANVRGHEGTEVFYEGRWHYFDGDIQMYHRLRPPQEKIVASREDLFNDPTLATDQPNPSNPYIFPDRPWQAVADMYTAPLDYQAVLEEQIHTMDYRLRPGEELVRTFSHSGRWFVYDIYPQTYRRYRKETGPEGPTERYWPRRQWGNGFFAYAPDLTTATQDAEAGAEALTGLEKTARGLAATGNKPGEAVFAFESPYVYCGVPDPLKRLPAEEGAKIEATFDLPAGTHARIDCRPGPSGDEAGRAVTGNWITLWDSVGNAGEQSALVDFTSLAEGRYRFDLRFVLEGAGATLLSFATQLWIMVSPHSLPALKTAGANRMQVHHGDRFGLNTRSFLLERLCARKETFHSAVQHGNLRHDPDSMAVFHPVDPAKPWQAVFELRAPAGGKLAWAGVYALFEGRKPDEDFDGSPARIEFADSPQGPWQLAAENEIQVHRQGWHFGLFGRALFAQTSPVGYVRFSAKKGLKGFRVAGHYLPATVAGATAAGAAEPLEIEHVWYVDDPKLGRQLRRHVEQVSGLTHTYTVNSDLPPHNAAITLRAAHAKKK